MNDIHRIVNGLACIAQSSPLVRGQYRATTTIQWHTIECVAKT